MTEMYFSTDPQSESRPVRMELAFRGREYRFWTDHGVFSRGELDRGTELLLKALPELPSGLLLDLGCGWGPIGIILCGMNPGLTAVLSDVNPRALALAERNIPENGMEGRCRAVCSEGFEKLKERYDIIVTNPPIRAGKDVVYGLFADAARHLRPGGRLFAVIRKQQGAASAVRYLQTLFGQVDVIDRSGGYWIIRCGEAAAHDNEGVL